MPNPANESRWRALLQQLPDGALTLDEETRRRYCSDETEDYCFVPEAVAFPTTTEQLSRIARFCYAHDIPMTPRGAGTGLSGGALPVTGGLVVSFEKMNRILEVDPENMWVITEPGVITQVLQERVAEAGLFYPPDPASRGSCFIGGNVAENSGGPRALKYGVTKDYVLNLEIVLPDGTVLWTGAPTLKNATGYNLTQLMVGSEGTLAFLSKIVLRLLPHPTTAYLMLAAFDTVEKAAQAALALRLSGIGPSALEFMEGSALRAAAAYLNQPLPIETAEAYLLIEIDGFDREHTWRRTEQGFLHIDPYARETIVAESDKEKEHLWQFRRAIGHGVRHRSVYKEEDTVVPIRQIPRLLHFVRRLADRYGFQCICYGHIGDGNIHVNILKEGLSDEVWRKVLPEALRELFREVVKMGGTISGEHGIGYVQRPFLPIAFPPPAIQLMKQIKRIFDPKGLLNPAKIFPEP